MTEQTQLDADDVINALADEVAATKRQAALNEAVLKAQVKKLALQLEEVTEERNAATRKTREVTDDDDA